MTVREIYNWAKEHECLDIEVAKHINMEFYDVKSVLRLGEEVLGVYDIDIDRVVID